jgi:hypothetical protein
MGFINGEFDDIIIGIAFVIFILVISAIFLNGIMSAPQFQATLANVTIPANLNN